MLGKEMAPTPAFLPGNPWDRGAWWATVHGVTTSRTQLSPPHLLSAVNVAHIDVICICKIT